MNQASDDIGVVFLARGAEPDWRASCDRFLASYRRHRAGAAHALHVIFKGFIDDRDLAEAKALFGEVDHVAIELPDEGFDIGAYVAWAHQAPHETVCFFNTASEILCGDWLMKLSRNLAAPGVGVVGASGSYESLRSAEYPSFPKFPNIHVRTNAFMMRRALFCELSKGLRIDGKDAAYAFESGPDGLTRRILRAGLTLLLVGRNGRGYAPEWWPASDTFRQDRQGNLLVADNQTRGFASLPFAQKHDLAARTWGGYLQESRLVQRNSADLFR